jgi:hypothetical protein
VSDAKALRRYAYGPVLWRWCSHLGERYDPAGVPPCPECEAKAGPAIRIRSIDPVGGVLTFGSEDA